MEEENRLYLGLFGIFLIIISLVLIEPKGIYDFILNYGKYILFILGIFFFVISLTLGEK